jgi:hypothetical protein
MEHQLDATITVLFISKISSRCFGQTSAHLQERKTEIFTIYGIMSCKDGQKFARNMLSWSWRSLKLLLLHLVGVPYYFTYTDDARSNTNQRYHVIKMTKLASVCSQLSHIYTLQTQSSKNRFSIIPTYGHVYRAVSSPGDSATKIVLEFRTSRSCYMSRLLISVIK